MTVAEFARIGEERMAVVIAHGKLDYEPRYRYQEEVSKKGRAKTVGRLDPSPEAWEGDGDIDAPVMIVEATCFASRRVVGSFG